MTALALSDASDLAWKLMYPLLAIVKSRIRVEQTMKAIKKNRSGGSGHIMKHLTLEQFEGNANTWVEWSHRLKFYAYGKDEQPLWTRRF